MLEAMRQNSRSAIIYILFAVLIAAFVISFGPGGLGGSPSSRPSYAAKISGQEITEPEFHFAYIAIGAGNLPGNMAREQRIKEVIMDRLIDRELQAQEAERLGLLASEKEAAEMIADGRMLVMGAPRQVEGYAFKDGKFDYDRFRMVSQNVYGLTVKRFMEIERRELMASKLRELMRVATKVSPDEVKTDFMDKGQQADLEYVRFAPRRYEEEEQLSEADIENWARAHEDQIKKTYEERKVLYQKQDKTAHLRRVLIAVAKDAPADKVQEAQARADAALKTLQSGTRFADVVRTASEDEATRARGGDMGWRKRGFTGLGDEIDDKIFAAKEGDVVGPLRSDRGFEILKVEGFRQGDISLGQARTEIAEELARADKAKERARAAAQEAASKVKGGAKLSDLYPRSQSDSDEAKPKAGQGSKLQAEETGLFSRRGDIVQGIGPSAELAKAVFNTMKPGDTVGPIEVGGSFVVVTLKERKEPDMADFDKRKAELTEEYQRAKWAEVMQSWTHTRCTEENNKGKIKVNQDALAYEGGPAEGPFGLGPRPYVPCSPQRLF